METKRIPLSKLVANTGQVEGLPKNPRTIRGEKFTKLLQSIKEDPEMLDLRELLVIPLEKKFVVIGGNMRLLAMKELGFKDAPCKVLDADTPAKKLRAYATKDNVGFGDWDWEALANEWDVTELDEWGMDMPADFGGGGGKTDPDDVPEVPETPITVLGDVWLLGKHRIVCGDSTQAETVAKCLNGVKPHLMVTDPPYGVNYDPTWRVRAGANLETAAKGLVMNDDRADWRECWALFPGDVAYVWHGGAHTHTVAESLVASGFGLRAQIIWNKGQLVMGRGDYHWQHEPCWYVVRGGKPGHYVGGRKQTTVWDIAKPHKSETGHSTQKPVECMKRPIENNSSPGQAVYEPFSGSGTTIIAGEMTGRSIHAIELSPAYVDVAVKRWQDFTGLKAIHEATGRTFDEVMAEKEPAEIPAANP
jgi:DNA modification methylase